jgi:CheY-like chemotaxis protein
LDLFVGREGLGWQFLQLLRMDDETTSIPVLLCTTTVKLVHEIADYLVSIRVTVLRKPFTSKELERSVQKVLTTHGDHTSSGPADHNGNTSV